MRSVLTAFTIIVLISCGSSNTGKESSLSQTAENTSATANETPQNGVVGEWEQQYTCFDANGNSKLDPEEKVPSNTRTGFDWFRFNADGSCLRDKEMKFKSTYEIENKGGTRKLTIQNVHGYTIVELTERELILGASGAFIVYKRI